MKTLRLSIGLLLTIFAAILFSPPAQAQLNITHLDLTGIGTIAGGATTTVTNQIMDVTKSQTVALYAKLNFADATTSNIVYTVSRSIDGANFQTFEPFTWTVTGNGTTDVLAVTNINIGACGWLKLESIQNTHASIVCTNKAFWYSVKRASQ